MSRETFSAGTILKMSYDDPARGSLFAIIHKTEASTGQGDSYRLEVLYDEDPAFPWVKGRSFSSFDTDLEVATPFELAMLAERGVL